MLETVNQGFERLVFLPVFLIFAFILLWFAVGILLCVWVFRDAESRGMNGAVWVIIILIANIIGLIIYLVVRGERRFISPYQPPQTEPARFCTNCGHQISTNTRYCPECGTPVGIMNE